MEKYFEKLLGDYDKVLIEELGKGKLRKRLLSKLEGIISGNNLSGKSQENLLDKPFDYNALPKYKTRVENVLKPAIETYGDLQKICYINYSAKNHGGRSWQGEKEYSLVLEKYRNFGEKSVDSVISHLKQINFDFSYESAKKTFDKNK